MDFSRALIRIHDRIPEVALRDRVLIRQIVAGVRSQSMRLELRRLELAKPDQTFNEMREIARERFRDTEKTAKLRRRAMQADEVLNLQMCQGILDPSEVNINSAI